MLRVTEWAVEGSMSGEGADFISTAVREVGAPWQCESFNHRLLIVPAPCFTLLLGASQLLTAILLSKGQEQAMRFLVGTQFLAECQLSQLAPNRPSLLQRGLAKPKLACPIFKTCFYLKTNS